MNLNSMVDKKILNGYKRNKKKFLAPMNHMFQDKGWTVKYIDINYRYEIVPEILWLALLNEKYGIYKTSMITSKLFTIMNNFNINKDIFISCFTSSWANFNFNISDFHLELKKEGIDFLLSEGLSGFIHLFPETPLSVLVAKKELYLLGELKTIKKILYSLSDKESKETVFAIASVIYIAIRYNNVLFSNEIDINPKKLLDYPNTVDSLKIASTLRASILQFYGKNIKNKNYLWQNYFWQRCLELEPCKIKTLNNG